MEVVDEVLHQLHAHTIPRILVYNKADVAGFAAPRDAVAISAKTGQGLEQLFACIQERLSESWWKGSILIPYHRGDVAAQVHAFGTILKESYLEEGTEITCKLPKGRYQQIIKQLQ